MSIYTSKYDNGKVGLLKQLLLNNEQNGKPTEYEIRVDDLKIVSRTADASQFNLLEQSIDADTKAVTITLYEGQGKSSDKHIFFLKEGSPAELAPVLSGIDVDKKVTEQMAVYKKQMDYEKLEEKNKDLTEKLADAEEYIEKLEEGLEAEKGGRLKINGIHLGEIASVAAESLIRRNTHLIAKIPGAEGLAGLILEDNESKEAQSSSESKGGETTFKLLDDSELLSEEDKEELEALRLLKAALNEKESEQYFKLTSLFMENRKIIAPTLLYAVKLGEKKPVQETDKSNAAKTETITAEKKDSKQSDSASETKTSINEDLDSPEDLLGAA